MKRLIDKGLPTPARRVNWLHARHRTARCWLTIALLLYMPIGALASAPVFRKLSPSNNAARTYRSSAIELGRATTVLGLAVATDGLVTVDAMGRVESRNDIASPPIRLKQLDFEPACVDLSKGAKWLAFADSEGATFLWKRATNQQMQVPLSGAARTVSLRFSNDETKLACAGQDGTVHIWDVDNQKIIRQLQLAASSVQVLAFSPNDRRLAGASFSKTIKVFDLQSDRPEVSPVILTADSRVTALAMADIDHITVATAGGSIKLMSSSNNQPPRMIAQYPCAAWTLEFDASYTRLAAGSWDGTVRLWNTKDWQHLQSVKGHNESVTGLVFADRLGLVSSGLDHRLLTFPPELPQVAPSAVIDGTTDSAWVGIHTMDGSHFFVAGRERRFELWDWETRSLVFSRPGPPTTRCAAFSPNGKRLVTGGDDRKILVSDAQSGKTLRTFSGHPGSLSFVLFSREGTRLYSGCDGGALKIWDMESEMELKSWKEHEHQIYCAALSPDEKWLVTGGGDWTTGDPGELLVWDLVQHRVAKRMTGHKLAVWSVVFSPDGKRFMSSDSTGAVKVWSSESLSEERTLQHSMWVRPLAMSPDGDVLAVGLGDGSIRLWDTETWQETRFCKGHESFSFHLQFSPDGNFLTSSGNDGTVQIWPMRKESALEN